MPSRTLRDNLVDKSDGLELLQLNRDDTEDTREALTSLQTLNSDTGSEERTSPSDSSGGVSNYS